MFEEQSDWQRAETDSLKKALITKAVPYELSLIGEYTRLFLLLLAIPLLLWFIYCATTNQSVVLYLGATLILLTTLITTRGHQLLRIALLVTMSANVFALIINPNKSFGELESTPSNIPISILLFCLVTASVFEINAWARSNSRATLLKTMAWGLLLIPAIAYIVGVPLVEMAWNAIQDDEKQRALQDPNWNLLNEIAFRAAKFALFAVVTYIGACVGSFLNVVAYCVPKGESVGLRDSKCPQCGYKISRIDNLPIFSYFNLRAKCRNCDESIPARYLIVELIGATIFGSLFLYELVTGCTNVPNMGISHKGILWIILYPKWPAIAIYFYHALFMCLILVLSLMEWDKQRLRLTFAIIVGLAFIVPSMLYNVIQPVPATDHLPGFSLEFSPYVEQFLRLAIGSIVGATIGRALGTVFSARYKSTLTFAFLLTGMVLGWQALVQVSIVFGLISLVFRFFPKLEGALWSRPTSILLISIALHHPFWRMIASIWQFN